MRGSPPSADDGRQGLLGRLGQRLLRGPQRLLGLVVGRLRRDALLQQVLLPVEGLLREIDIAVRCLLFGNRHLVGRAQLLDARAARKRGRLVLRQRDPVRLGVEPEEEVALLDVLVRLDGDLDDPAGNVGRDRHAILLDIGVVGRGIAAAGQPEPQADGDQDRPGRCP